MVEFVNVAATKAHLSELLTRIEGGEEIVITRRGKPVARLSPMQHAKKPIPSLQAFRDHLPKQKIPASEVLRLEREESL
jgi:prevent-host-death family protein